MTAPRQTWQDNPQMRARIHSMAGMTQPPGRPKNAQQQLLGNPWTRFGLIVGGIGVAVAFVAPILAVIFSKGRSVHFHAFGHSWSPGQPVTSATLPAIIGGALAFIIPFAVVAFLVIKFLGPLLRGNRLLDHGIPAQATIVELVDTGVTINQNPRIKLELDVRGRDGRSYRATTTAIVSRLVTARYVPGTVVDVMVDTNDPQQVALVEVAGPASPTPTGQAAGIEQRLLEINAYNERLSRSGEPARATIVKTEPMNTMVNGNNPAMSFILKVHPVGAEPFLAEAAGVIGEQALHKYQPGCDIYVRFEQSDKTRVSMDHS
jgi:hypothetical protein